MPSFSNDLLDTETVSDQTDQASLPSPIYMFNTHRYMLPTSPVYLTDSQATPYLPISIPLYLEPQSSPLSISLPNLPGGILSVIMDPQQCQPLEWILILPIPNHLSYVHIAISTPLSTTSQRTKIWKSFSSS